jgi:hypothetical protein
MNARKAAEPPIATLEIPFETLTTTIELDDIFLVAKNNVNTGMVPTLLSDQDSLSNVASFADFLSVYNLACTCKYSFQLLRNQMFSIACQAYTTTRDINEQAVINNIIAVESFSICERPTLHLRIRFTSDNAGEKTKHLNAQGSRTNGTLFRSFVCNDILEIMLQVPSVKLCGALLSSLQETLTLIVCEEDMLLDVRVLENASPIFGSSGDIIPMDSLDGTLSSYERIEEMESVQKRAEELNDIREMMKTFKTELQGKIENLTETCKNITDVVSQILKVVEQKKGI